MFKSDKSLRFYVSERKRKRERQIDRNRQTDRQREKDRQRERGRQRDRGRKGEGESQVGKYCIYTFR